MNAKHCALLHKITTTLFLVFVSLGPIFYVLNPTEMMAQYEAGGFPGWIMYFNGTAKALGVIALAVPSVSETMKQWAYAGFLYVLLMAFINHAIVLQDGQYAGALIGLLLWGFSYGLRGSK